MSGSWIRNRLEEEGTKKAVGFPRRCWVSLRLVYNARGPSLPGSYVPYMYYTCARIRDGWFPSDGQGIVACFFPFRVGLVVWSVWTDYIIMVCESRKKHTVRDRAINTSQSFSSSLHSGYAILARADIGFSLLVLRCHC